MMFTRSLFLAAAIGLTGVTLSGCINSGGLYGDGYYDDGYYDRGPYYGGGYYTGASVIYDRGRDHRYRRSDRRSHREHINQPRPAPAPGPVVRAPPHRPSEGQPLPIEELRRRAIDRGGNNRV